MSRKGMFVRLTVSVLFMLSVAAVLQLPAYAQARWSMDLVVADKNGKVIGPVIATDLSYRAAVAVVPYNGKWLPVAVQAGAITSYVDLYFHNSLCEAPAYGNPTTTPFPATGVKNNYLYVESGPAQEIQVWSGWNDVEQICYSVDGSLANYVPMTPVVNLGTAFTSPFSVIRRPY